MHPRTEEFRTRAADRYGFEVEPHEFPEGTKTAEDAAKAVGCPVEAIASAIAIKTGGQLVVCVTSGANRVSMGAVAELRGVDEDAVGMADPDVVADQLGWSIGGVPPFCHDSEVPVYVDETLTGHEEVWAAAGTPQAVFPIAPDRLVELSGGTVAAFAE